MPGKQRSKTVTPQDALVPIGKAAVAWFSKHHRDLPWRRTRDAYRIWISECMLQQTQVATVIPYYERFLQRFPDVHSLAQAELDEVYQLWAGLGYYRRARQLHAAAIEVVRSGHAPFPIDRDSIAQLPGIGRYTASAIASFAYDQRCGIVEANTQRLYARLIQWAEPLSNPASQRKLWEFAESIIAAWPLASGELNQSLMEIGSQVCKPREPLCGQCPLQSYCKAFQSGRTESIPVAKPKKIITELREIGVLVSDSKGRWLLRRRQSTERWAGLWDFPRFDTTELDDDDVALRFVDEEFRTQYGSRIHVVGERLSVRHSVTRYRIHLRCFEASLVSKLKRVRQPGASEVLQYDWYGIEELERLALSSSARKVADWLKKHASPR